MSLPSTRAAPLEVVIGLVRDAERRVLVARRSAAVPFAGRWEFPGGKRRAGESARAALSRELDEELGIRVLEAARVLEYCYEYPERRVYLDVWSVARFDGRPEAREAECFEWVAPGELDALELLDADWPIVERLQSETAVGSR